MRMRMRMRMRMEYAWALLLTSMLGLPAFGAGRIVEVEYPPSERPGELGLRRHAPEVWIPDNVAQLRG